MSAGSTVPYAKDAIVTKVAARSAITTAGVKVSRGWPRQEDDLQSTDGDWEAIWVGRDGGQAVTAQAVVPFMTAGNLRLDEEYTLWVTVQVMKPEGTATDKTAQDRAYALGYEVVAAYAAEPGLGVSLTGEVLMFEVRGHEFGEVGGKLDKGGYGAKLEIGLDCFGRIHAT